MDPSNINQDAEQPHSRSQRVRHLLETTAESR